MDLKQALIVDDSKSAQYVLKRMLEKFELRSDVAFSAEEALAYLSHHHPAVIFLDENMPGMNGIEALKTLKSNPSTALIPVIMYTSADDDVFVTQARALGALDILSKSNMQPESLARVLTSLKIFPAIEQTTGSVSEIDANKTNVLTQNLPPPKLKTAEIEPATALTDLEKVSKQISRLFEIHISAVREQINNSAHLVTKRVLSNLEKSLSRDNTLRDSQSNSADLEAHAIANNQALQYEKQKQKQSLITNALLSALLLSLVWVGYYLFNISSELELATKAQQISADVKKQEAQQVANSVLQLMDDKANGKGFISLPNILKAMNWLQNADFQYNFNEQPLSDTQIINLATFARILSEGGYAGALVVNLNFGNFCLENVLINSVNTWRLAANDLPASECKQLKDLNPKFAVTDYATSPAFRAFERNLAAQPNGRITVRLTSNGISQPRVDYPPITATTTAGEWNSAAARNNRLSIQFEN